MKDIKPKTIDGIKQLAKKIKKRDGIQHAAALDVAAVQAGYANFVHARRQLASAPPAAQQEPRA